MKDKIYHWMIIHFPIWMMYKHFYMDSYHKIYIPRFGWSKKQIKDTEELSKELIEKIEWD